jgi:tetratricopeptide (TPR) repeat protein
LTLKKAHIVLSTILLVVTLVSPGVAQRKKKQSNLPPLQGIKQREAEFYFTEGEKYFILEDYAKALLYYQRSQEIDQNNATVYYKIAEVLAKGTHPEDLQKASVSIENALKLEKDNKFFYLLATSIYNGLGKFDKAAQTYETMISEIKGTDEYLYELASVYQYANEPEEAIKIYNRAENILGIHETSSIQKQRLYLDAGKIKEAIAEGDKLMAAFPDDERYVMGFAEILSQKGQRPLAITYLEKFIKDNKSAGNSKMLLAGLYRDSNQEQKARDLLLTLFDDTSIDLNSKVIILGAYSTEINQSKSVSGDNKEAFAMTLFQKLEKMYPNETNVHILGGDLYLSAGKNSEAQSEYLKAIELGDANYEVWQNLLFIETKMDQIDVVLKHSDSALELFPNQGMLYYFNGYSHERKHHYPEAISSLQQAKKLITTNVPLLGEINSMLGDAYNATREYEKSDRAYEEALEIDPNNYVVLNNYSYYLAARKTNLDKAEKMSALLVKNNPDNPSFLDTHAWVLYTKGKYKDAKKIIEKAISTTHASAIHFEHYGDILFQLGDINGAVQQWEKARGLSANNEALNKKIANKRVYE